MARSGPSTAKKAKTTAEAKAKGSTKAKLTAKAKAKAKASEATTGPGRGRTIKRAVFACAAIVFVGLSLSFPVRTWFDQQAEIDNLDQQMDDLDANVAALEADIAQRTSPEGARTKALCQGPYSAPGTEVYSVPGLNGCQHVP